MKLGLTTTSRSVPPHAPQVPIAKAGHGATALREREVREVKEGIGDVDAANEPPQAAPLPESETTLVQSEVVPRSKRRSLAAAPKTRRSDEAADSTRSTSKRRTRSAK